MTRQQRKRDEAFVFENHSTREYMRPALLGSETAGERQLRTWLIKLEDHDPQQ